MSNNINEISQAKANVVIKLLEKDLDIIRKSDSNKVKISDIESILMQSILRFEKIKKMA